MTAISFPYGSTRLPGQLSERRSLDPTEGNRGKYARVSCYCVPAPGYAAVLGRRETLLENAPGEFEFPAVHQNSLWTGLRRL